MHYTKKIITILVSLVSLTACNLDYAPENTYVDEKVYKNEKTALAALCGAYVRLNVFMNGAPQDQNNYANAGHTLLLGDLTTDNMLVRDGVSTYLSVMTSEFTSSDHSGLIQSVWWWAYNAIDYANNIIRGIETFSQFDEAKSKQFIAEARFIRAFVNFRLLCIFGDKALLGEDGADGIILQTVPYNGYNPDNIKQRSSNAACWQQIISDLTLAIPDLPQQPETAAKRSRASRGAAQLLLSRVYLYKATAVNNTAELSLAADLARQVIEEGGFGFSSQSKEYENNLFPSNEYVQNESYPDPTSYSNELIFFAPSRIYTANYPNGLSWYQKKSYYVNPLILSLYDQHDVRGTAYLISHGSKTDNPHDWTTEKYTGDQYDDVIYMRLSEAKLTYAEALARAEGVVSDAALKQLNDIHQRAYTEGNKPALWTASDFGNAEAFIDTVLTERRRELAFEGHHRYDLMRTRNRLNDATLGAVSENRWNLPVPEYEIRISYGVIKQSSGYLSE